MNKKNLPKMNLRKVPNSLQLPPKARIVLAISQILILIAGIIAISYSIGSSFKVVSAAEVLEGPLGGDSGETSVPTSNNELKIKDIISGLVVPAQRISTPTPEVVDTMPPTPPVDTETHDKKGSPLLIGAKTAWSFISKNFGWSLIAISTRLLLEQFGLTDNPIVNSASWAFVAGAGAHDIADLVGISGKVLGIGVPTLIGIGVAIVVFILTYKEQDTKLIQFTCFPWEAPTGGEKCEECNSQEFPCSEYQCRSLGQSCELINQGTSEEKCVWVNRNDIAYPIIREWTDALLNGFVYRPDNTVSPPDRGVKIEYQRATDKCVPAFTPLSFGITTNEPAKCKIDYVKKDSFDNMTYYFGGDQRLLYNHTQTMSLPGADAFERENITIENDNEYELSVRCQDANGNANIANFIFKFCVDEGPDTTPPLIVTTSLLNNMPIAFNQSSVDLKVYVNEPLATRVGGCKWSHTDQDYGSMEQDMTCATSVIEFNAQMLYECSTTLTGLNDRVENKFYFRCEDKAGNNNSQSYEFTLLGTQPLVIDWVKPNGTVKDSTDFVKVTLEARTSAGYNEGQAICYYSETGQEESYIEFFNTNSYQHSQDLFLPEGPYTYNIKCVDLGGNSDVETTNFNVESDSDSPIVVRAYHEDTYLKLVTNEPATCVYDTVDCNYIFADGLPMTTTDDVYHYTDWNTQITFYIKCQDDYGNQPLPDQCSIIARGVE